MTDPETVRVRPATVADADEIAALHERENQRAADRVTLAECLRGYPAAVAHADTGVVGFTYCGRFAPDILEVRNLLVAHAYRSGGLGARLLTEVEQQSRGTWSALILSNSDLHAGPGKRPATAFYLRHGWQIVHQTPATRVFTKSL